MFKGIDLLIFSIYSEDELKRRIITTADGSKTIQIEDWNEQYHSKHGAIQEAYHVFIEHGLRLFPEGKVNILEIGFGTGLNALITLKEAARKNLDIEYVGVEAYPVTLQEVEALEYCDQLQVPQLKSIFQNMHQASWDEQAFISDIFKLTKQKKDFRDIDQKNLFNLIYFDAFGARVQPDLWTENVFAKMFLALRTKGVLVTYSAKGSVRRALQAVGFEVERLPGPPGKREMLRAIKP